MSNDQHFISLSGIQRLHKVKDLVAKVHTYVTKITENHIKQNDCE